MPEAVIVDVVRTPIGRGKPVAGDLSGVHPVALLAETYRALVERINMIKRHTKARAAGQEGQIVEKEAPIHVSNLMLVCPKCTNTVRVGNKTLEDGSKVRICKKCSESVEPTKKQ